MIRKHFRKSAGRLWTADNIFNVVGLGLMGVFGMSLVSQRDYASEMIEFASPLRLNSPNCVWHPIKKAYDDLSEKRRG
jgi:hypothetical protein